MRGWLHFRTIRNIWLPAFKVAESGSFAGILPILANLKVFVDTSYADIYNNRFCNYGLVVTFGISFYDRD